MLNLLGLTLMEYLSQWNIILALILAILGLATSLLAKRITVALNKGEPIESGNGRLIVIKSVGFALVVIALLLMMIPPA